MSSDLCVGIGYFHYVSGKPNYRLPWLQQRPAIRLRNLLFRKRNILPEK